MVHINPTICFQEKQCQISLIKFLLREWIDFLKPNCSNKLYMGLDIHIDAKHGNSLVGTGRGAQWRLWASALLLENTNTGLVALIFYFLGSPVGNNVPQPMACCYKDEAHSSCSTIGKKDHMAMARCCLQGSPTFGFAQVNTFTCRQQQLQGEKKNWDVFYSEMVLWCFMNCHFSAALMSWS